MISNLEFSNNCFSGRIRGAAPSEIVIERDNQQLTFQLYDREICIRTGTALEYKYRCVTPGERYLTAMLEVDTFG